MAEVDLHNPLFDLDAVFQVDDYLYFYRETLTDERSDAEVAALVKLLALDPPMDILDLACGFGRHANRLAAQGHRLTGVDYSAGFLELAREDALARGVSVTYLQGDMRQVDFDAAFDRVMLLFTSFGYFDDEENLLVLRNVTRALRPGGLFITDSMNRDAAAKYLAPGIVTEKDGNLMIDRNTFDSLTGQWRNRRIIIREGVRRDAPFSVRLYNLTEMHHMLQSAGLELHAWYGGLEGQPFSADSRRLVVLAKKPA